MCSEVSENIGVSDAKKDGSGAIEESWSKNVHGSFHCAMKIAFKTQISFNRMSLQDPIREASCIGGDSNQRRQNEHKSSLESA